MKNVFVILTNEEYLHRGFFIEEMDNADFACLKKLGVGLYHVKKSELEIYSNLFKADERRCYFDEGVEVTDGKWAGSEITWQDGFRFSATGEVVVLTISEY